LSWVDFNQQSLTFVGGFNQFAIIRNTTAAVIIFSVLVSSAVLVFLLDIFKNQKINVESRIFGFYIRNG
jgi:hypothetical protein